MSALTKGECIHCKKCLSNYIFIVAISVSSHHLLLPECLYKQWPCSCSYNHRHKESRIRCFASKQSSNNDDNENSTASTTTNNNNSQETATAAVPILEPVSATPPLAKEEQQERINTLHDACITRATYWRPLSNACDVRLLVLILKSCHYWIWSLKYPFVEYYCMCTSSFVWNWNCCMSENMYLTLSKKAVNNEISIACDGHSKCRGK